MYECPPPNKRVCIMMTMTYFFDVSFSVHGSDSRRSIQNHDLIVRGQSQHQPRSPPKVTPFDSMPTTAAAVRCTIKLSIPMPDIFCDTIIIQCCMCV